MSNFIFTDVNSFNYDISLNRYPLLLTRIYRATTRGNSDRESLVFARRKIEEQITRINEVNSYVYQSMVVLSKRIHQSFRNFEQPLILYISLFFMKIFTF